MKPDWLLYNFLASKIFNPPFFAIPQTPRRLLSRKSYQTPSLKISSIFIILFCFCISSSLSVLSSPSSSLVASHRMDAEIPSSDPDISASAIRAIYDWSDRINQAEAHMSASDYNSAAAMERSDAEPKSELASKYKTLRKSALIEPLDASDSSVVLKWPVVKPNYGRQSVQQYSVARDSYLPDQITNAQTIRNYGSIPLSSIPIGGYPIASDANMYNPYEMAQSELVEQQINQQLASQFGQTPTAYQQPQSPYQTPTDYEVPKQNIAPYPPHRDYLPVPGYDPAIHDANADAEEDPLETLKKKKKKLRIKPVDHEFFKTDGKHKATLPYKPTEPFLELSRAINDVRKAVYKIKPIKGLANQAFNQFTIGVKARIKNMRGPYGYSYPTGYYDFRYEPDYNPAPSEEYGVYVMPPDADGNQLIDKRSDSTDNNSMDAKGTRSDQGEGLKKSGS